MASQQQIRQNFVDVNNAWSQFQGLVNYTIPSAANNLRIYRQYLNSRRNFR